jgi:hypothetical protein
MERKKIVLNGSLHFEALHILQPLLLDGLSVLQEVLQVLPVLATKRSIISLLIFNQGGGSESELIRNIRLDPKPSKNADLENPLMFMHLQTE